MNILERAKLLSNIVGVGDIHGEYGELGYLIKERYKITDSIICLAGDIGLGFHKPNYYKTEFTQLNKILQKTNNIIFGVRGNHDNPIYFDGSFEFSNILLVPDYYFLETAIYDILFIGGGISIDRKHRNEGTSYWINEIPIYNEDKLKEIKKPDIIITHASPSFCIPTDKQGLMDWAKIDSALLEDCSMERMVFTKVFDYLENNNKQPKYWCYGHYHMSGNQLINGTEFKALSILEFFELNKPKEF